MVKLKEKILKFLSNIFGETIRDIVKHCFIYLFFGGGLFLLIKYFRKLINFLNINIELQIGLLLVIFLIGLLIGYELIKPKKRGFKSFFYEYQKVSWRVNPSSDWEEVWVEREPYCIKCKVKYLMIQDRFGELYTLLCPTCGDKHESFAHSLIHEAVKNIAEAKVKGFLKSK